jgi:hypothetical protein
MIQYIQDHHKYPLVRGFSMKAPLPPPLSVLLYIYIYIRIGTVGWNPRYVSAKHVTFGLISNLFPPSAPLHPLTFFECLRRCSPLCPNPPPQQLLRAPHFLPHLTFLWDPVYPGNNSLSSNSDWIWEQENGGRLPFLTEMSPLTRTSKIFPTYRFK